VRAREGRVRVGAPAFTDRERRVRRGPWRLRHSVRPRAPPAPRRAPEAWC